jgi:hypothetical protein
MPKNPKMVPEMQTVNNSVMVSGERRTDNALYKRKKITTNL